MIIRFYAVDGDSYSGGDIDLSFNTYEAAKAAYDSIKAPYKILRAFGDSGYGTAQETIEYERYYEKSFFE